MILEFRRVELPEYSWQAQEINSASLNMDSIEAKGQKLQSLCVLITGNYISIHEDYLKLGTGALGKDQSSSNKMERMAPMLDSEN